MPQTLGRRARKALATRQALLEAGLTAFGERSPAEVSVLDITEAVDVAKGVFYLHFRNKEQFLLALWDHVHGVFLTELAAAIAGDLSPGARVERTIAVHRSLAEQCPRETRFRLRMAAMIGPALGVPNRDSSAIGGPFAEMAELRRWYYTRLALILEGGEAAEPSPDAVTRARLLDAFCWSMLWQAIQLGEPLPDEAVMQRYVGAALTAAGDV